MANFRKYGNGPFRVAVIHGGPGDAGSAAPIARKLGETRGALESIQTAKTLDGQVEELRQVVEQNATTPVAFIGHSWGAWLSSLVTAKYPELVRKLILVGSGPFEEQYVPLIAKNRLRRLSQEEQEEYLHLVEMLNKSKAPESTVSLSRLGELDKADSYDPIEMSEDPTYCYIPACACGWQPRYPHTLPCRERFPGLQRASPTRSSHTQGCRRRRTSGL